MAKLYHDIVQRAIQVHGSLGITLETPLAEMWMSIPNMALADGPTEVRKVQVAKAFLGTVAPTTGLFPTDHGPTRLEAARHRHKDTLASAASIGEGLDR